jgi:uncharacterized repeat protein (TIGR03803 family)
MFTYGYARQQLSKPAFSLPLALVTLCILSPLPARAQTETVLYSFNYPTYPPGVGCPPGSANAYPHAGLLMYNGHIYGSIPEGGPGAKRVPDSDDGMVFRLSTPKSGGTPWSKDNLHNFVPAISPGDGAFPCSRLIENNGVLIGTTMSGGNNWGTIFALTPPGVGETAWTESILYSFLGLSDGGEPFDGLVMAKNGAMYGVTRLGNEGINTPAVFEFFNGVITQLTNTVEITYNGDLLLDETTGSLFGTTQNGGAHGYGNVFQLTPSGGSWAMNDLYDFTGGSDGATPNGGLAGRAGDLFGTTQGGGTATGSAGGGVLFELRQEIAGNPLYTLIVQHTFTGASDGAVPSAGLYKDATGTLWGTTMYGGPLRLHFATYGTIYKLYPDRTIVNDWHYDQVYSFAGEPDGAYPQSLLTEDKNGNLYGTTNEGGTANDGTVFEFTP